MAVPKSVLESAFGKGLGLTIIGNNRVYDGFCDAFYF